MSIEKAKEVFEDVVPKMDASTLVASKDVNPARYQEFMFDVFSRRIQVLYHLLAEVLDVEMEVLQKTTKETFEEMKKKIEEGAGNADILVPDNTIRDKDGNPLHN